MPYNIEFGSGNTSTITLHNANSFASNNVNVYIGWLCVGGVVHSLLNALKSLTLKRGWAK